MSKVKLLERVIADIRSLAESLQAVANAMGEDEEAEVAEQVTPKKETKVPKKKEIKFEDVRAALAVKSQAGMTTQVRELIEKYDGTKLSEVDPKHYAAILKDSEELTNG